MNINLPPDQQAFIDDLVAGRRFTSAGEVVSEAIKLLISRERLRQQLALGIEQADRNEGADHDTVFSNLRAMAGAAQNAQGGQ